MKFYSLLAFALAASACAGGAQTAQNTAPASASTPLNERPQSVTAHTSENKPPTSGTAPGRPAAMGDPIDTAKFDGTIAEAEKALKGKPNDDAAKKTLAQAYYDRGFALTEARQYASALGDYRRALNLDPSHEDSKTWHDQIVSIYKMLKKDPPKEGEEPAPLPFKKS